MIGLKKSYSNDSSVSKHQQSQSTELNSSVVSTPRFTPLLSWWATLDHVSSFFVAVEGKAKTCLRISYADVVPGTIGMHTLLLHSSRDADDEAVEKRFELTPPPPSSPLAVVTLKACPVLAHCWVMRRHTGPSVREWMRKAAATKISHTHNVLRWLLRSNFAFPPPSLSLPQRQRQTTHSGSQCCERATRDRRTRDPAAVTFASLSLSPFSLLRFLHSELRSQSTDPHSAHVQS